MTARSYYRLAISSAALVALMGCTGGPFGARGAIGVLGNAEDANRQEILNSPYSREEQALLARTYADPSKQPQTLLGSLFRTGKESDVGTNVNRYLWNASLDTLSFLPVETVDPFTGVISTGYGTPPGGRQAYRATIYISDPSLDARSLKVALQTRGGGAVSAETVRQVEDAILNRARQLRVRDSRL